MTKRLGDSDRRAVDLLLDRSAGAGEGNGNGNGNGGYVVHAQPASEPGLQAVERVLGLLNLLPAEEPPADLMMRTLARIDSRAGIAAEMPAAAAAIMSNRPHA